MQSDSLREWGDSKAPNGCFTVSKFIVQKFPLDKFGIFRSFDFTILLQRRVLFMFLQFVLSNQLSKCVCEHVRTACAQHDIKITTCPNRFWNSAVRQDSQFDMRYRRRVVQSSRVQSPIRKHPTNKNLRTIERAQSSHSLQQSCPLSTSTFTIPLDTLSI